MRQQVGADHVTHNIILNNGHSKIDVRECWRVSNPCIPEPDTRIGKLGWIMKYCHGYLHMHNWRQTDKVCSAGHWDGYSIGVDEFQ